MNSEHVEFNIDGITLRGKLDKPADMGEKAPLLVLLHGFTGWMDEVHITAVAETALEAGYAVLRYDQYGHGTSDGEFRDHNVLLWMLQAMKVIGIARTWPFVDGVYLAGHSQGGLNTILVGGMMSDCIKALLPLSPAVNIAYGARRGEILGQHYDMTDMPAYFPFKDRTLSSDYLRAARMLPLEFAVQSFRGPVCIIHGTADEAVPYSYAQPLQEAFANAGLITIEGDDHCYHYHLDQVTAAVKEFLLKVKE